MAPHASAPPLFEFADIVILNVYPKAKNGNKRRNPQHHEVNIDGWDAQLTLRCRVSPLDGISVALFPQSIESREFRIYIKCTGLLNASASDLMQWLGDVQNMYTRDHPYNSPCIVDIHRPHEKAFLYLQLDSVQAYEFFLSHLKSFPFQNCHVHAERARSKQEQAAWKKGGKPHYAPSYHMHSHGKQKYYQTGKGQRRATPPVTPPPPPPTHGNNPNDFVGNDNGYTHDNEYAHETIEQQWSMMPMSIPMPMPLPVSLPLALPVPVESSDEVRDSYPNIHYVHEPYTMGVTMKEIGMYESLLYMPDSQRRHGDHIV